MKATELRIGNYVYYKCNIEKCFALRNSGVDFYRGKTKNGITTQGYIYDAIQPIPLTEEILLKCGYATCSFRDNHFVIKGHTIWKCNDLFICDKNGIVLKYLHQLQNLYHALTGEELTVNF